MSVNRNSKKLKGFKIYINGELIKVNFTINKN